MNIRLFITALASLALVGCGLLNSGDDDGDAKSFDIFIPSAEYSGTSITIRLDSVAPARGFDIYGSRCEVIAEGTLSATAGTGSSSATITQAVVVDTAYILPGYWRMDTAFTTPNTIQRLFLGPPHFAAALDSAVSRVSSRCEEYLGNDSIFMFDPPPSSFVPVCGSEESRAMYLEEARYVAVDQLRIEVSTKTLTGSRLRVKASFNVRCTN